MNEHNDGIGGADKVPYVLYKSTVTGMPLTEHEVLAILRNPHRFDVEKVREARLRGADLIERYKDAYLNMKGFAEANGLDTVAYFGAN